MPEEIELDSAVAEVVAQPVDGGDEVSPVAELVATEIPAPGKATMKPHPLLAQKQRRKRQIGNLRQSNENPLIKILDQHEHARMRIVKIGAAILGLMLLAIAVMLVLSNHRQQQQWQQHLDTLRQSLAVLDGRIANAVGHDRDLAIMEALAVSLAGAEFDFNHSDQWQTTMERYQHLLAGRPEPGASFVSPSALVDMVNIPRGRFAMGRQRDELGRAVELPRHQVELPYEFWLSRTEITNAQFRRFFTEHRPVVVGWEDYHFERAQQPAVLVDWHAASEFCRLITELEQEAGRLPQGYEYRLPTEAEWEYACRAGTETAFYWGEEFGKSGSEYANLLDEAARQTLAWDKHEVGMPQRDRHAIPAPVGSYRPNAFGLNDMCGNVWEWCWDWYNPDAYRELYMTAPVQAEPVAATIQRLGQWGRVESLTTTSKVIRGGCWGSVPSESRSAARDSAVPETTNSGIGFRLALAPKITIIDGGMLEDQIMRGPAPLEP